MSEKPSKLRCRPIAEADVDAVTALLSQGFPERGSAYWTRALAALARRPSPEGYPRFGYLLEAETGIVGALLLIFTRMTDGAVRCNVSSWYVDPAYRAHAAALVSAALKFKDVTYLNVSPAPNTWPILDAQGYRRYSEGQFAALPALSTKGLGVRVRPYEPGRDQDRLPRAEVALLDDHVLAGCLVLVCEEGAALTPLVFLRRDVKRLGRVVMQLAYCRDTADFTRNAGAVGRFLLREGAVVVLCDGEGPIRGLLGRFFRDRAPKYFRGRDRPRLNDLAYTEAVLFGA